MVIEGAHWIDVIDMIEYINALHTFDFGSDFIKNSPAIYDSFNNQCYYKLYR